MGNARNMNARYPDQIDQRNIDAINKGNWWYNLYTWIKYTEIGTWYRWV